MRKTWVEEAEDEEQNYKREPISGSHLVARLPLINMANFSKLNVLGEKLSIEFESCGQIAKTRMRHQMKIHSWTLVCNHGYKHFSPSFTLPFLNFFALLLGWPAEADPDPDPDPDPTLDFILKTSTQVISIN